MASFKSNAKATNVFLYGPLITIMHRRDMTEKMLKATNNNNNLFQVKDIDCATDLVKLNRADKT